MMEAMSRSTIPVSVHGSSGEGFKAFRYAAHSENIYQSISSKDFASHQVYLQGKRDGVKDLQEEVIKMAKALFQIAMEKAEDISEALVKSAIKDEITIHRFCLKIETWEKVSMIIIIALEDYVSDKIELLYESANQLSQEINNEKFNWEYIITPPLFLFEHG